MKIALLDFQKFSHIWGFKFAPAVISIWLASTATSRGDGGVKMNPTMTSVGQPVGGSAAPLSAPTRLGNDSTFASYYRPFQSSNPKQIPKSERPGSSDLQTPGMIIVDYRPYMLQTNPIKAALRFPNSIGLLGPSKDREPSIAPQKDVVRSPNTIAPPLISLRPKWPTTFFVLPEDQFAKSVAAPSRQIRFPDWKKLVQPELLDASRGN